MRILVTGGTGTIGRMVCRKLYHGGHDVVVLSRDPSKQLVNCPHMACEVGYVEDEHFVQHVVRQHSVDAVIHTAANKHIGICEDRPTEAVSANVLGSLNILKAIESNGVQKGIFVSSDKACNHGHVYGITKYLMERLVVEYSSRLPKVQLNCVRFGNVFGSSGSVVPIWQSKITRRQDIDLRIFRSGIVPTRLAMLPSEAADFIVHVFNGQGAYQTGSVLMNKTERLLNLRTLAEVMTEDTESKVREVPALEMESEQEAMFSEEEAERISEISGVLELGYRPNLNSKPYRMVVNRMNHQETREFVTKVLLEMNEWM